MRVHLDVCDVAALHPPRFCRPTEAVAAGAVRTDRERVSEREREREYWTVHTTVLVVLAPLP